MPTKKKKQTNSTHLNKTPGGKKKETQTCSNSLFAQLFAQNMTNKNCKAGLSPAVYSAFWHQSVHMHRQKAGQLQASQNHYYQHPGVPTGRTVCLKAKQTLVRRDCYATGRKTKETSQPRLLPTSTSFTLHVLLIASTLVLLKINSL